MRHSYRPGWYLPGGGVRRGESLSDALLRELNEEIGLSDVTIEGVLGLYHSRNEYKDDHVAVLIARSAHMVRVSDRLEISSAGSFALDALPGDISPATSRRIAEYREGAIGLGYW